MKTIVTTRPSEGHAARSYSYRQLPFVILDTYNANDSDGVCWVS